MESTKSTVNSCMVFNKWSGTNNVGISGYSTHLSDNACVGIHIIKLKLLTRYVA